MKRADGGAGGKPIHIKSTTSARVNGVKAGAGGSNGELHGNGDEDGNNFQRHKRDNMYGAILIFFSKCCVCATRLPFFF